MKKILLMLQLILLTTGVFSMTSDMFQKGVLHFNYKADALASAETKARIQLEKDLASVLAVPAGERTFENTVIAYNKAFDKYGDSFGIAMFLAYVSPDQKLRDSATELQSKVSAYMVEVGTRKDLYNAIKEYADTNPKLDVPEAKLLENMMIGFRKSGLHLPDDQLEIYRNLSRQRSENSINFSKNIRDNADFELVTREDLKGLPEEYINRLERLEGFYKVTLNYPDYVPFMKNSESDSARRALEFKYLRRGGDENVKLLENSLDLRRQTASLLGYKTFADMKLEYRMAKNPKTVEKFLKDIEKKLKPYGKKEDKQLLALKEERAGKKDKNVYGWESAFWSTLYKKINYDVDAEKIKEYFPADVVIDGMLESFGHLFGIEFKQVKIPVWHKDVRTYELIDSATKQTVAYVYMDLFPREGKYKHAACFDLVDGHQKEDGSYQKPFTAIVANFNPPSKDAPSLLKHDEVETLFHEFGHVLHNALTTAKYSGLSGTAVAGDFVEVPSQILENWAWHPAVLKKISKHYKTGEPLPDEIIEKMIKGKNVFSARAYQRQNFFAQYDMDLHTSNKELDTTKEYFKLAKKITGVPVTPDTIPQASFDHIMGGYDAGYYGYLWAKVIAEDMFSVFEKEGLDNPETGKRFRDEILAVGGTYEEQEIVEKFLGRKVDNKPFLKSIGLE
ncbi:Zn-dependent oligopeptidase [Elusimicrobium minutum Pei191]|uniref:Zn-dependent oligopeptidase n=1 Tax=Elusimicrobium minutum (strain Pei191) TaxID=445932 RepID=B2KEY7_ELUMP|nr:M3 family metallopeptidase [Elusimicrobium minutum]ACC99083.1 Zn-dependent oligopeptidase [Elusimicrobium minutum Pei191]